MPASEEETMETEEIQMLHQSDVKTYMSVHAITDETSAQYQYIHNSGEVRTDERGFLCTDDGYRGAALGSALGDVGTRYIFTLDTGRELKIVKVEEKDDAHTDENNFYATDNGDILEFVVDTEAEYMQENVHENGLVFSGNFNNCPELEGTIVKIERVIE